MMMMMTMINWRLEASPGDVRMNYDFKFVVASKNYIWLVVL
jgi:hypothetical protein